VIGIVREVDALAVAIGEAVAALGADDRAAAGAEQESRQR
jgi:hypothetical protein